MTTGVLVAPPAYTARNVSASANLYTNPVAATGVSASNSYVDKVIVVTAGTAACSIIDSAGTSATAANTVWTSPAATTAGTIYSLNVRCFTGISAVIAGGAVLTVTYGDTAF